MNQYPHCACHLSFSFPALPSPSLSLLALLSAWPSLSLPLFLFRFASSRSCPPPRVLLSSFLSTVFLDVRIHFPSFTVHCPPYSPNMSSFGPCCSIFLISDALSRVRFIHLLSPSALSFNSLSVLFPFFLVYRSYFLILELLAPLLFLLIYLSSLDFFFFVSSFLRLLLTCSASSYSVFLSFLFPSSVSSAFLFPRLFPVLCILYFGWVSFLSFIPFSLSCSTFHRFFYPRILLEFLCLRARRKWTQGEIWTRKEKVTSMV